MTPLDPAWPAVAPPTFEDVRRAARRLSGHAVRTPLLRHDRLDALAGTRLFVKPECEQHVRAFKYRGARNRLAALSAAERGRGVVAFSSGNHAQGVARAARELGIDAVIVMPFDAPEVKVAGVRADGATLVGYNRATQSREAIAAGIAAREGRTLVPSFDDPLIIAGQGTVGLEIAEDAPPDVEGFDAVLTCIGGGGLCAGIALSLEALSPRTHLLGAEPAAYNDHKRSLAAGRRVRLSDPPPSLCDAILTPQPGALTWPINARALRAVHTVTDAQCLSAMKTLWQTLRLRAEPGGAAALAAALDGALSGYNSACVVISGGNVDEDVWRMAVG